MENIAGTFTVNIGGSDREMKVTFGLVEKLERRIFQRPLFDLLGEASSRRFYISDVAVMIHEALAENGDTRLSLKQVGEEIMKAGASKFAEVYVEMLVYALTGGVKHDGEDTKKN